MDAEAVELIQSNRARTDNQWFNIPPHIERRIGRQLHKTAYHPLCTLKQKIEEHFRTAYVGLRFQALDNLSPIVTVKQNFDDMLTPADHPSRNPTDTFYLDSCVTLSFPPLLADLLTLFQAIVCCAVIHQHIKWS
jgi:phenylalanyl-tRNA synthetase alpha chain